MRMKRNGQEPPVHCVFTEDGEPLEELILQSLRLFAQRELLAEGR